jgi:hypothetical protein
VVEVEAWIVVASGSGGAASMSMVVELVQKKVKTIEEGRVCCGKGQYVSGPISEPRLARCFLLFSVFCFLFLISFSTLFMPFWLLSLSAALCNSSDLGMYG